MPFKDPAKARAMSKVYKDRKREAVRAAGRLYYQQNRDHILARQKSLISHEDRVRRNAANLARYHDNKEAVLAKRHAETAEQREQRLDYQRRYRETHRENLRLKALDYAARTVEVRAIKGRERRFGLEEGQFDSMVASQNGKCAICGATLAGLPPRMTHVDHDHETGKVRGILCHYCNTGLGHFRDDVEALRRAIEYLSRYT